MNFRSYSDLISCLVRNIDRIPRDIDLIIGIPRSGTMAANTLSLYMNLPFMDLYSFLGGSPFYTGSTRKSENWIRTPNEAAHILLVDDSVSSGKAMSEAKKKLVESGFCGKLTTMAVYTLGITRRKVDIALEICEQPRLFEWNFLHHWALEHCCMDIDGVLCKDPSRQQNDDGNRYLDFLRNATPKFIPTQKVGMLISCRLEKYRTETEAWLDKCGVTYGQLTLLDGVSAKERALTFDHGAYKAQVYAASDCLLFFESDYDQALTICKLSGKPVFCIENMTLIDSENVVKRLDIRQKELRVTLKRGIKKILGKINYVK